MSKRRNGMQSRPFKSNETPLPKPARRGAGKVHPNSTAARKWGARSWTYRGEGDASD